MLLCLQAFRIHTHVAVDVCCCIHLSNRRVRSETDLIQQNIGVLASLWQTYMLVKKDASCQSRPAFTRVSAAVFGKTNFTTGNCRIMERSFFCSSEVTTVASSHKGLGFKPNSKMHLGLLNL